MSTVGAVMGECGKDGHYGHARRYLNMRGEEYGVGPKPYGDRCATCHGPSTDAEVYEQFAWTYRLLCAVDASKKGALIDKERQLMNALALTYKKARP